MMSAASVPTQSGLLSLAAFIAFALVLASCGRSTPTPECLEPQDGTLVPAECPSDGDDGGAGDDGGGDDGGAGITATPLPPGAQLFVGSGCGGCHTIDSIPTGGKTGPDLSHIGGRADAGYIRQSILDPDAVIAEVCPSGACFSGVMPQNFGELLTDDQVDTLVDYLVSLK